MCQKVHGQYWELKQEHENPRAPDFGSSPEDLQFTQIRSLEFLFWYRLVARIETRYLDHIDGKSEFPVSISLLEVTETVWCIN